MRARSLRTLIILAGIAAALAAGLNGTATALRAGGAACAVLAVALMACDAQLRRRRRSAR